MSVCLKAMPASGTEGPGSYLEKHFSCKESPALTSGGFQLQTFVYSTQSVRMGQLALLPRVENFFNVLGNILSLNGTQYM